VQYLPWMFLPMAAGLLALWRRPFGFAAHVLLAGGALWLFGIRMSAGILLIAMPLALLGLAYLYGRVQSTRTAARILVLLPLGTMIVSGAYPAWRVLTRPRAVDVTERRLTANGVDVVWAPAGPGWPDEGASWSDAKDRCDRLTADGRELSADT